MKLYPMILTPFVSETVWGGRRLIEEYSVVTDKRNAAEAWVMSAHKNGSSTVANGEFAGRTLREVYLDHPELGGKSCAGFSDFPVLIKFIDAASDLSVQVHPDDAYCLKKGSGAGKTESWYILDCEPNAYLLLGFERDITREQFRQSITDGTLTDYVKKVPVKRATSSLSSPARSTRYARASCSQRFSKIRTRPTEYTTTVARGSTASRASFMLRTR